MRFADLLGLPLVALWQQKSRTCLTTLGVVFGSFVLAASLSINRGVQETIRREAMRNDMMRRVMVRPEFVRADSESDPTRESLAGDMADARRERIHKALVAGRGRNRASAPRLPLTPETIRNLAGLEHVATFVPVVGQSGTVVVNHRPQGSTIVSARPEDADCRSRLLAGRFFDSPDEQAVVVSEYLLYQCGFLNDDDISRIVGKTLRVELSTQRGAPGFGVSLNRPDGSDTTQEESAAVDEIRRQLPDLLDFFNLSSAEIAMLRAALARETVSVADEYAAEFPIVGVVRLPTDEELKGPRDPLSVNADVILPCQTASELFFRSPRQAQAGLDQVVLFIDHEEHVKEVFEKVKGMGLRANAPLEFIERIRLMYALIFGGMTFVAAVALVVAALGIANTMLMSVLERTREIGIMKAVGAGNAELISIFVVEGGLIGLVGGSLGMLLAWGASFPGDGWIRSSVSSDVQVFLKESIFVFPPWLAAAVLLFAVLVTTAAAVYPARRAARIDPVAALRHE
jgi:putative ABC transport system permease protein